METAVGRPPLVLLVDPIISSRHWMWRAMSRAFGVLEAGTARGALDWIEQRPDIDALVVQDDLPDQRGADLVKDLALLQHPVASRSIVLTRAAMDPRAVLAKLATWFLARDAGLARALLREADRRMA
jgi:response regulator RpfG family c-di-GMP phosphodiesterase